MSVQTAVVRDYFAAPNAPLAAVFVDKQQLLHNYRVFAEQIQVAPVLKSNAYGHGLIPTTRLLAEQTDTPFVCLVAAREVHTLRTTGVDMPVVVIGYVQPEKIAKLGDANTAFALTSRQHIRAVAKALTDPQPFHLKVETGMNRYGIRPEDLPEAISVINTCPEINLTGAFTHFSDAFAADSTHTRDQIDRWKHAVDRLQSSFDLDYLHAAATSGHFYQAEIPANVERIGIGFYGITSYASRMDNGPALSLWTQVAGVKSVQAGEPIGYNQSFRASAPMRIAVLPTGYNEGVDRRRSNSGQVQINDHMCPIVGKVSMNATMVDITDTDITVGDPAALVSDDPDKPHSILNQARNIDIIPYDLLTSIPADIQRQFV